MLCVYAGQQRCIGFIVPRGKTGFEAVDVSDQSRGLYPSQKEAAEALRAVRR
jgi:hypothetical protein